MTNFKCQVDSQPKHSQPLEQNDMSDKVTPNNKLTDVLTLGQHGPMTESYLGNMDGKVFFSQKCYLFTFSILLKFEGKSFDMVTLLNLQYIIFIPFKGKFWDVKTQC